METSWEKYQSSFKYAARRNGFDNSYITTCLEYAEKLYVKGLPIIYDQHHFCLLVGFKDEYVLSASNSPSHYYRTFKIAKKNGGFRNIEEPLPGLKQIQRWILNEILYKIPSSKYSKAFIKGSSIKENAKFHRGQEIVMTLDIKDYFESLKYPQVYALFLLIGYSKAVATLLANLCCLNNSLPQGAPTSPYLSNLLTRRLDARISAYTRAIDIRYTRYADDMTFSGDFIPNSVITFIKKILLTEGLQLNENKTRIRKKHQRQEVTGIVVNEKLRAPREIRQKLRQEVYYIEKFGLQSHLDRTCNTKAHYLNHLIGLAYFVLFINPNDHDAIKYIEVLKNYF